jgi:hypothetical protein
METLFGQGTSAIDWKLDGKRGKGLRGLVRWPGPAQP